MPFLFQLYIDQIYVSENYSVLFHNYNIQRITMRKKLSQTNFHEAVKKMSALSDSVYSKQDFQKQPLVLSSRQHLKQKYHDEVGKVQTAKQQLRKSKIISQMLLQKKRSSRQSIEKIIKSKQKFIVSEILQYQSEHNTKAPQNYKIRHTISKLQSGPQVQKQKQIKRQEQRKKQEQQGKQKEKQKQKQKPLQFMSQLLKNTGKKQDVTDNLLLKLLNLTNNSNMNQSNSKPVETHNQYFKDKLIRIESIHQEAQIDMESQNTSQWLGVLLDKCTSSSFKHFICRDLDYNQVKTYCCEQVISNVLQRIAETIKAKKSYDITNEILNVKEKSSSSTTQKRRKKKIIYQFQGMKFLNDQMGHILQHLCHKYPQTNIEGANKKLSQIVEKMDIDNWGNDEFDLLRLSRVKFELKESGDYAQQIMKFLNFIITLPYEKSEKYPNLTNLKYFQKAMTKIFSVIYTKDNKDDLSKVLNSRQQFDFEQKKTKLDDQDRDYMEKVKKYTTVLIGSKISGISKTFSKSDIKSGIIKIEDNAVARVINKWAQQLREKFTSAQKSVLNRSYRFKSAEDMEFHKINKESKEELYKILSQKKRKLQEFIGEVKQSVYDLSFKLACCKNSDLSSLKFLSERERKLGQFAVKMSQSSSQYFISILQRQINLLLESVEIMKQRWVQKYKFKQSPSYEALKINLVTLKIGDLLRCKVISNQQEIIRILNIFTTLNQSWDSDLIKIIRVKNRLQSGTKDVLINFMFDNICPCEIQLAVAEKFSEKQQYFDKFNHFLYELKRGYLGPIMEMCKIWYQYQNKSLTFVKQIQKTTRRKLKIGKISQQFKQLQYSQNNQLYQYKFPFICSSCQTFCPRHSLIFFNTLYMQKIYCGYCKKIKTESLPKEKHQLKIQFFFRKYIVKYPNLQKFISKIYEISSLPQLLNQKFIINIPVNSRLIHMQFSMIIKFQTNGKDTESSKYAFVTTHLNQQGQIIKQVCSESFPNITNSSSLKTLRMIEEIQEQFQKDYVFFGWNIPTKLIPLPDIPGNHYFELIDQLLPSIRKLQALKGKQNVKVAAVQIQQNQYYFFPFFLVNEVEISEELVFQSNIQSIQLSVDRKSEVLELQNKTIINQFQLLKQPLKLKIAYTIKEIYLNNNQIKSIDFIEHFHKLKIFQANKNEIERIPKIPFGLTSLRLNTNKIPQINPFFNEQEIEKYRIAVLDLSYNLIQKLQNFSTLKSLETFFMIRCQVKKIENLPSSLKNLALGFNKIEKIQNLDHLKKLSKLNIAGNQIKKIQNLKGCESLSVLMLSRNQITKFQNLEQLPNLTILHLSHTGLISNNNKDELLTAFRGLTKLKRISVEGNKIVCIFMLLGIVQKNKENLETRPLVELEEILFSFNELRSISHFQRAFPWLKILHIESNKIESIDNIVNLTLLEDLNVKNNCIKALPTNGWQKLFKMKNINLSYNEIRVVPSLKMLIFLKKLNLQGNKIVEVKGFPLTPIGQPDYPRQINLSKNCLFSEEVSQEQFAQTFKSISELKGQVQIDLLENGSNEEKLQKINQLKQENHLISIKVEQTLI